MLCAQFKFISVLLLIVSSISHAHGPNEYEGSVHPVYKVYGVYKKIEGKIQAAQKAYSDGNLLPKSKSNRQVELDHHSNVQALEKNLTTECLGDLAAKELEHFTDFCKKKNCSATQLFTEWTERLTWSMPYPAPWSESELRWFHDLKDWHNVKEFECAVYALKVSRQTYPALPFGLEDPCHLRN